MMDGYIDMAQDDEMHHAMCVVAEGLAELPTLSLNTLRDVIYEDAVVHGLWEWFDEQFKPCESYKTFGVDVNVVSRRNCGHRIKEEGYELIDAAGCEEAFSEELADVVIMCFSVAGKLGIDIDAAIRRKMEINKGRPWKHGKEEKV